MQDSRSPTTGGMSLYMKSTRHFVFVISTFQSASRCTSTQASLTVEIAISNMRSPLQHQRRKICLSKS
jgi:hypothetical protein